MQKESLEDPARANIQSLSLHSGMHKNSLKMQF
jgi:hypothetical protein